MKLSATLAFAIASFASFSYAHMEMTDPPPLRSRMNPFRKGEPDYDMESPLDSNGSNFPCRGSLRLLGTPQGKAVADWNAGTEQKITVSGGAFHSGGSCQASLSSDNGKTWTAIKSWHGRCPISSGKTSYNSTVPADTPSGKKVFAWTWFNKVGNREMYMNCAVVNVIPCSEPSKIKLVKTPFSSRPAMFVANVGNRCGTTEGTDLQFPNPGPDVEEAPGARLRGPSGKGCAA
ncbi:hypothetical protein HIM_03323 [Hirsutella minnesotensis 3608]|uniref:Extracellular protein n=1 Tax=Hirsutella minnesotensis 3608 TaxID=1043627 RepID=A0A0F8A2G5_9HYPO|nr:hypothetical protein HIM_03323 [Hirsutella minnesotensis 3608]